MTLNKAPFPQESGTQTVGYENSETIQRFPANSRDGELSGGRSAILPLDSKQNYVLRSDYYQEGVHGDFRRELLVTIRQLGKSDYQNIWQKMQDFTDNRTEQTPDEIWLLEHPPVFTQGLAGKPEHVLNPREIPVIQTDRGGQVTYHGPGQLVVYVLFDLQRLNIGTRQLVRTLEKTIIETLADYNIVAETQENAPGIYVNGAKICSIGLRVRKNCSYHGIAFNIDMDLEPFSRINPCGYQNLQMIQLRDFINDITLTDVSQKIVRHLIKNFGYNNDTSTMAINHDSN